MDTEAEKDFREKERAFQVRLMDFLKKEEDLDVNESFISYSLLAFGAMICRLHTLAHGTKIGCQMEFINKAINSGIKNGDKVYEEDKKNESK